MPARALLAALTVAATAALTACSAGAAAPPDETDELTGSVWVANEGGDSLTVLDAATGEVVTTVEGVPQPHNVQASADGETVWAVTGTDQLVALATDTLDVTGLAATDSHPAHVVGTPDGGVLVTSSGQPSLYAYDARLRPGSRTELDGAPHGLRLSADGGTAVVANTGAGTLDVVEVASGAVRDRVDVGPGPVQVAVSGDGRWAWASVAGDRTVVRVDLATGEVVGSVGVDAAPAQVFLTSTGRLLVAGQGDEGAPGSTLTVLDASTLERLAEVEVGSGPHGVVADPAGTVAWVTNLVDGTVSVVDLTTSTVTRTVDVGRAPNGVSFSPRRVAGVPETVALELPEREDRGDHGDEDHGH